MTQIQQQSPDREQFDMKAGTFTVPTLCIRGTDMEALDRFLAEQVSRLPQFFEQAPLVIDLSQYESDEALTDFPFVVGSIRGHGMIPVGVRGASPQQREQAEMLELAVMPAARSAQPKAVDSAPRPAPARDTLLVDKPVRSGQRVYASGCDLVLTSSVGSGAEVAADGSIHAYAPVSGRIMAGATGNAAARIFCRDLRAELVSIAGRYKVSEDFPAGLAGRTIQVSLHDNRLCFDAL